MHVVGFARSIPRLSLLVVLAAAGWVQTAAAAPALRAVETLAEPAGIASRVEYKLELDDLEDVATSATLVLELPEGPRVAERRAVQRQPRGVYWTGELVDGGPVLLTIYDGLPSGLVYAGPYTYEISPGPGGPLAA